MNYNLKHKITGEELTLSQEEYEVLAARGDHRNFDITTLEGNVAANPPEEVVKDLAERKGKEKS